MGPDLGPTVCKGYQQRTKVAASKERVKCGCSIIYKGLQIQVSKFYCIRF